MAEASISWAEDQFNCSVCLDLLKDPVTIPCGHTYCKRCISGCWDQEDRKGIYSCPQCRQTFSPRPVLSKNVMFAEMVEKLKKTRCQAAPARCICILCLVDEHKNHDTVSTAAARAEKQVLLSSVSHKQQSLLICYLIFPSIRETDTAVEYNEKIFTELIRSIEKRRSEVKQLIRDQERAAVNQAEERLARLELELDDLRWRDAELKQLSQTDDHINFLQSCPSVSLTGSTDSLTVSAHPSFDDVVKSVFQLRDKLQQFLLALMDRCSLVFIVKTVQVIVPHEYATTKEFLQYNHVLTLDLNSVNKCIRLSEGNTVMSFIDTCLPYPNHPDRFDWTMALCRESVTERCYWEVEWAGNGSLGVDIGVTYKSISRKGDGPESAVRRNDQSWSLYCSPDYLYVDHSAGTLSFYSVSDTMSLIHRFQTTFTQPLYAVFGLDRQTACA
uniref:RING-type domain-containing protein n=1 Tax=Sinocyclocheilus anshuiensis TaxID=1608454 RepID=A0A671R2X0_9TELE